ncbi:MAG: marine proteobacterial sortase target protein [Gammaproteobacteria bacterium]|nr:marine proteobacterial sortase target protein [Gammaproteobacteria bacterium]MBQ0839838.1 marine proteobacterial sortase target protein [Gammaproteobacteria bacterium]
MNYVIRCLASTLRLLRRLRTRSCLLFALPLLAASAHTLGEVDSGAEPGLLGSAMLALNYADGRAEVIVPQLHSKVDIHITGPIARVRLAQTFSNPSDAWAEAVYTFPLPPDSAVDHLQMQIGERVIEGEIQECEAAQQIYQQARQAGQHAALVEQHRPNIFSTHVANVPPGEELTVVLEYQQQVIRRGTRYSLHYPMSMTPRYTAKHPLDKRDMAISDGPATLMPMAQDAANNNATEIWIDLQAGFELDDVESRYHPVSKIRVDDSHWQLRLDPQTHAANADFVVEWQGRELAVPQVHAFTQRFGGQEYALLQVMPPQIELEQYRQARDIVYVIDTSGSMGGESLRQARRALLWAIARLDENDRFNIIEFNSESWSLFDAEREASAKNIASARHFVENLEARGGTEMGRALDLALCGPCVDNNSDGRLRQVLFLTDGAISNEAQLFATIKSRLGNSRLFTIGIGSAPNHYFMRKAAKMGRGTFVHIGKINEVEEKITQFFERIDVPVMSDIKLQLRGENIDISPALITDLYAGEPLIVAIKADNLAEHITLRGRRQGQVWQQRVPLSMAPEQGGIHVAWARKKIESLLDERLILRDEKGRQTLRNEVIDIALRHHLVTPFTSLVAVDKTPVRPETEGLHSQAIKANAPKGRQFSLARTATGVYDFISAGFVVLLLALGLLWLSRHYSRNSQLELC